MKKFALFTMLLCSGLMYGCTKPTKEPPKEDKTGTEQKEGTTAAGDQTPAPGGGEKTE